MDSPVNFRDLQASSQENQVIYPVHWKYSSLKYAVLVCKAASVSLLTREKTKNGLQHFLNSVSEKFVLSFLSMSCIHGKKFS